MNFKKGWDKTVVKVFGHQEVIIQRAVVGLTFLSSLFLAGWVLSFTVGIGEPWFLLSILISLAGVVGLTLLAISVTEEGMNRNEY